MKIEIWSDFVCPYCYIGKRRFEKALENFEHKEDVKVIFRSFELDPSSTPAKGQDFYNAFAAKFGISREKAEEINEKMTRQAEEEGLVYRFDTAVPANTMNAHRLLHFSKKKGKEAVMAERLFRAYFTDSEDIGDIAALVRIAEKAGLDGQEIEAMLKSGQFIEDVHEDETEGSRIGVTGVPFYVVNQKYGISGAQPSEYFLKALQQIWSEDGQSESRNSENNTSYCTGDECE